jgi:Txe/YoeB family toxin of Txe-Axe toxin-antitoxin module
MGIKLRIVHVDGNEWKWYYKDQIIMFSPEKKRINIDIDSFGNWVDDFYDDEECINGHWDKIPITPSRISDYIKYMILGYIKDPYENLSDDEKLEKAYENYDYSLIKKLEQKKSFKKLDDQERKCVEEINSLVNLLSKDAMSYFISQYSSSPCAG